MKIKYHVNVRSCEEIHELPGAWSDEDFRNILELADFDDWNEIDVAELKDYTLMALQEMKADEAGEIILNYIFDGRLTKGQIQNLSHEMMEEKLWEEYADINLHRELYNCSVLLKWAFPNKFPETNAIECIIEVETKDAQGYSNITKTFLTRLLANGMDEHGLLKRLFKDQIAKTAFPEAEGIIWDFKVISNENKATITIFSSEYWLEDMDVVNSYSTEAFSD